MRHRHLTSPVGEPLTVAGAASVLERGDARATIALLRRLHADPFGPDARAAEIAAAHVETQGLPALIRHCLRRWRGERSAS